MIKFILLAVLVFTFIPKHNHAFAQGADRLIKQRRDSLVSRRDSIQRFDGAKVFFEQKRSTKEDQAQSMSRSRSDYIPRDNRILNKIIYTYYSASQSDDTTTVVYDYQYRPDSSYFFSDSSNSAMMTHEILDTPDSTFDKYSVYYIDEKDTARSIRYDEFSSYDCDGEYCDNIVQTIEHWDDWNYNTWMFSWQDTAYFNPYAYSGMWFEVDPGDGSYYFKEKYWESETKRPVFSQTHEWDVEDAEWELSSEYEMLEESPNLKQYIRNFPNPKHRWTQTFNDAGQETSFVWKEESTDGGWIKRDSGTYSYNEQGLLESYVDFYKKVNLANNTEEWLPYHIDSTFYDAQGKVSKYIQYRVSTASWHTFQRLYTRSATDSTYTHQRFNRTEQRWITYDSIHYEWSSTSGGGSRWRERVFDWDYSIEQLYLREEELRIKERTGNLSKVERRYYDVSGEVYNYQYYEYVTKELPIFQLTTQKPAQSMTFSPTTLDVKLTHGQELNNISLIASWDPEFLDLGTALLSIENEDVLMEVSQIEDGRARLHIWHENPNHAITSSSDTTIIAQLEMIPLREGTTSVHWLNDANMYTIADTAHQPVYPRIFESITLQTKSYEITGRILAPHLTSDGEITLQDLNEIPVSLQGVDGEKQISKTDSQGTFSFDQLNAYGSFNYLLSTELSSEIHTHWDIRDIILINQQSLHSWQKMAGDINNDWIISDLDAFLMTEHLLGKETMASLETPIRAIHLPTYDDSSPFVYQSEIRISENSVPYDQDFLLLAKGDVDFSSFSVKATASSDTLYISPTIYKSPDGSFRIDLDMEVDNFPGMQAALKVPSMVDDSIKASEHIWYHYDDKTEELRWVSYGDSASFKFLSFIVMDTSGLDFNQLNDGSLESIAINQKGEVANITYLPTVFHTDLEESSPLRPFPNPVDQHCFTDVSLTGNGIIYFELVDLHGKIVYRDNQMGVKGFQRLTWDLSAVPSGLYTYRISVRDFMQTGSVVKK